MTVRLIGMLFSGKWFSLCTKYGERTDALAVHILPYCPCSKAFRFVECRKKKSQEKSHGKKSQFWVGKKVTGTKVTKIFFFFYFIYYTFLCYKWTLLF